MLTQIIQQGIWLEKQTTSAVQFEEFEKCINLYHMNTG